MKNINLSVDGGGTSLRIIAFDDDLNFIAQSKSGSVNPNFESDKKIRENISEAVKLLIAILYDLTGDFKIKDIYETIVGSVSFFNNILKRECGGFVKDAIFHVISEGHSHVYAASLRDKGVVALAGTGSGAIYCDKDKILHLGGYGIPVGDQGSGAYIGIQGMSAAIKNINNWGEKTLLTERLYKYLNIDKPYLITKTLYKKNLNQRVLFAGFCPSVAECEKAGDKIAKEIIYSAGRDMGLQVISVLKKAESENMTDIAEENPVIYASGGAWKGTPYMLETMAETISGVYPGIICRHGLFDPVMSGVVKFIFDKTGKYKISGKDQKRLEKEFKDYLFKFNK
ncbi:MAG: hypothetical protein FWF92_00195 [Oscillospiraceae bacterium]|nr:hypothetical protein [Oscillospiraceae bacterium]